MKATLKYLCKDGKMKPFAIVKAKVIPGDYVETHSHEVHQVNQSTCIYFSEKILGEVNPQVKFNQGEEVDIHFKCKKKENCGYPFCGSQCEGNEGFYVAGREERGY